jgi:anti-anti-sigma factor
VLSERPSTAPSATGESERRDRCHFGREFDRTSIDCPAFQRAQFIAATSYGKPLGAHVACAHLVVGELSTNQFYPRCALGSEAERVRWIAMMGPARLEVQRALGAEFERLYPDSLRKLIAAKAEALAEPPDRRTSRQALAAVIREFVEEFGAFVSTHASRIAELGFSANDLTARAAIVLGEWQNSARLDLPRGDESTMRAEGPTLLSDDTMVAGALTISRSAAPASLTLVGSIDQTNVDAVDAALRDVMANDGVITIDLSAVTFCSVAGLRMLVRTAQPGRITLSGMQPHLQRALAATGLTSVQIPASTSTDLEVAS